MRLFMAIDGACRRNGKPDCTASGGVFVRGINDDGSTAGFAIFSDYEYGSKIGRAHV